MDRVTSSSADRTRDHPDMLNPLQLFWLVILGSGCSTPDTTKGPSDAGGDLIQDEPWSYSDTGVSVEDVVEASVEPSSGRAPPAGSSGLGKSLR